MKKQAIQLICMLFAATISFGQNIEWGPAYKINDFKSLAFNNLFRAGYVDNWESAFSLCLEKDPIKEMDIELPNGKSNKSNPGIINLEGESWAVFQEQKIWAYQKFGKKGPEGEMKELLPKKALGGINPIKTMEFSYSQNKTKAFCLSSTGARKKVGQDWYFRRAYAVFDKDGLKGEVKMLDLILDDLKTENLIGQTVLEDGTVVFLTRVQYYEKSMDLYKEPYKLEYKIYSGKDELKVRDFYPSYLPINNVKLYEVENGDVRIAGMGVNKELEAYYAFNLAYDVKSGKFTSEKAVEMDESFHEKFVYKSGGLVYGFSGYKANEHFALDNGNHALVLELRGNRLNNVYFDLMVILTDAQGEITSIEKVAKRWSNEEKYWFSHGYLAWDDGNNVHFLFNDNGDWYENGKFMGAKGSYIIRAKGNNVLAHATVNTERGYVDRGIYSNDEFNGFLFQPVMSTYLEEQNMAVLCAGSYDNLKKRYGIIKL